MVGSIHRKGNEAVLIFSAKDAILYVEEDLLFNEASEDTLSEELNASTIRKKSKKVMAYPATWATSFGENYYNSYAEQIEMDTASESWNISESEVPYKETENNVTTREEAASKIKKILTEIGASDV